MFTSPHPRTPAFPRPYCQSRLPLLLYYVTVLVSLHTCSTDGFNDNILYMPANLHDVSLPYRVPGTGEKVLVNYTVTEEGLQYYNTTIDEIRAGHLFPGDTPSSPLVLRLLSGRSIDVHVTERTIVQLVGENGRADFGVDLISFSQLTMADVANDSTLAAVPQPSLPWPSSSWRPLRTVMVAVNGSSVTVTVNKKNVVNQLSTNITVAGLLWHRQHGVAVTVLHPRTCHVTFSRVFPTSEFGGWRDLVGLLRGVAKGRLVVLAGLYDGSLQLLEARKYLQEELGSLVAANYMYRDSWVWVFIKGGQTIGEAFSPNLPIYHQIPKENSTYEVNVTSSLHSLQSTGQPQLQHFNNNLLHFKDTNVAKDAPNVVEGKAHRWYDIVKIYSVDKNGTSLSEAVNIAGRRSSMDEKLARNFYEESEYARAVNEMQDKNFDDNLVVLEKEKRGNDEKDEIYDNVTDDTDIDSEYYYSYHDKEEATVRKNMPIINSKQSKSASPLMLEARIPVHEDPVFLLLEYDNCDGGWKETTYVKGDPRWVARMHFCQTHDGYGSLCDCKEPFELRDRATLQSPYDMDIPILVLAANRTRLLFRLLETLALQPGVHKDLLTVVMDDYQEDAARLAYILGFRLLQHQPEGVKAVRVSRNLRFGLFQVLNLNPEAKAFIVLEDDLVLSPDFYKYMQHTFKIFSLDHTVYCVSAFNHLAYPHTSYNASLLYRVGSFPAYGWMVSRGGLEHILPRWFPANVTHDWDFMFGTVLVRDKKECIVPDVNRALHGGIVGLHSSASWFTERHYSRRNINTDPHVQLVDMTWLVQDAYESEMEALVAMATPVEVSSSDEVLLPPSKSGVYVIYVDQPRKWNVTKNNITTEEDGVNEAVYKVLAQALNIWNTDVRELHESTWRLHYHNHTLLVVGFPLSRYSKYKPPHIMPITIDGDIEPFILEEFAMAHVRKIEFKMHYETPELIWNKNFVLGEGILKEDQI